MNIYEEYGLGALDHDGKIKEFFDNAEAERQRWEKLMACNVTANEVIAEQRERAVEAESRAASAEKDAARLNWAEKHLDAANVSGYGADDKWVSILHHDGNKAEGASLRDAIDAALSAGGK